MKNCEELFNTDDQSKKNYSFKEPFVSFEEYIKIFVEVNSEKPDSIRNDLKIFFFKVIFLFIVKERADLILKKSDIPPAKKDVLISKPIESWEKEDWNDCAEKIQDRQLFLVKSNIAELIIESLKRAEDNSVFCSILRFCIAFLLGGNK